MGSAHSVSLQIYVFPFTCFAFSLFFCHFVFSSSSLPPSRAPHCAASSRRGPLIGEGEIGAPFRSPARALPLARCGRSPVGLQLIDADLYDGTASWGGEVLFHLAPLVFFSPYSILLGGVCNHCVQLHKRGIGALCAEFRRCIGLSTPPRKEPAWAASGGCATAKKMWVQMHGNGALFAAPPPVRPRERSPSRVVEPCRRRAREETERHGRERDKCRAKT